MSRAGPFILAALALGWAAQVGAGEVPEQFRVWGGRTKTQPVPQGWPEAVKVDAGRDLALAGANLPTLADPEHDLLVVNVSPWAPPQEDFRPAVAGRCTSLAAQDCPGQYGPITFAVFPCRDAMRVTVTDLTGPEGRIIGSENFDVRAVQYRVAKHGGQARWTPVTLETCAGAPPARGDCLRTFWITYFIPPDAPPGPYEGEVRVAVGGARKAAIPLRLAVYPFTLVEPDASLYMYYNNSTAAADLPLIEKQLADQRCHGMNAATLVPPVARDGRMTREGVGPWLDAFAKAGFAHKHVHVGLWNRITSEWLNTPDKSIGMYCPWFRYYPFSETLDRRYVETVTMIRDEAKERGLDLVVSVADEPGSHPWTTEATQHYNALLKREVPGVVRELTVGGGWAMKRPEHDLWKGLVHIWTTNRWLPERLALVRQADPDARIGIYNMGGGGSAAGGVEAVRAMFGFFAWKAKAAGAAQWTYYHNATPEHNYTWPADDPARGPVPTVRWETAREGTKDRRYLATLEHRLAGRADPAAEEARTLLKEIAARIELRNVDYDPISGGRVPVPAPGTFDTWRNRIAADLVKLGQGSR